MVKSSVERVNRYTFSELINFILILQMILRLRGEHECFSGKITRIIISKPLPDNLSVL